MLAVFILGTLCVHSSYPINHLTSENGAVGWFRLLFMQNMLCIGKF